MDKRLFTNCKGFDWDAGNAEKNWEKHKVSQLECEQAFFNRPLLVEEDKKHAEIEPRWYLLGQTDKERKLFIVFTIRRNLVRVISARDQNAKERALHEKQIKRNT
ncbi:MAG: BrnT family toxin [Candidatus Marinimicrobia bacterium]|nr:BrnT family toxin [Candidatus Neomarinimicrobiota bacterium]